MPNRQKLDVKQKTWNIIKLYNRCENYKCLPKLGGMQDQSERIMGCFDIIRSEYQNYQKENMDRQTRLSEAKAKLKRR